MDEKIFNITELIKFIELKTDYYNNDLLDVFVCDNHMNILDIEDAFGKKVFEGEYNYNGWFVFMDPCNLANWSHRCEYWFIVNEDLYFNKLNENWMPNIELDNFKKIIKK